MTTQQDIDDFSSLVSHYYNEKGPGVYMRNNQSNSFGYYTVESLREEINGEIEYDEYDEVPTEEDLAELQELLNVVEANDFSKTGVVLVIEKDLSQKFFTVQLS